MGADTIDGGLGSDTLNGGDGNDELYGDVGADVLSGGAGNDIIDGGPGTNTIDGGSDFDLISFKTASSGITTGFMGASSTPQAVGSSSVTDVEGVIGSEFGDNVNASTSTVNVFMVGMDGNDTLIGGSGNDIIIGGRGYDVIYGNDGNDVLFSGMNPMNYTGTWATEKFFGGEGDDKIVLNAPHLGQMPYNIEVDFGSGQDELYIERHQGHFITLTGASSNDAVYLDGYKIDNPSVTQIDWEPSLNLDDWKFTNSMGAVFEQHGSDLQIELPGYAIVIVKDWQNGDLGLNINWSQLDDPYNAPGGYGVPGGWFTWHETFDNGEWRDLWNSYAWQEAFGTPGPYSSPSAGPISDYLPL